MQGCNRSRRWRAGAFRRAPCLLTLCAALAHAAPGDTELVSVTHDGQAAAGDSTVGRQQAISSDGRYVAFVSFTSTLVSGDTNGGCDVFVRDRSTGVTHRVSVRSNGAQAAFGDQCDVAISGSGRFVAFTSTSKNLVRDDTGFADVFVHDRETGATRRLSVTPSGGQSNGASFGPPSISDDGRYVAFASAASNLVDADDNGNLTDVFVHDRKTGRTQRVSDSAQGGPANGQSGSAAISGNGRYVAFRSTASNLVPGDANGVEDVFVFDRHAGLTELVSVSSTGEQADFAWYGQLGAPALSADGRYVAFASNATTLAKEKQNIEAEIFVRDRWLGTTEWASRNLLDRSRSGGDRPSLSADGRYLAYQGYARSVYVRDRLTGITEPIREAAAPSLSDDGRIVAFQSNQAGHVPGDTNGDFDVFAHERPRWSTRFALAPADEIPFGKWTVRVWSDGVPVRINNTGVNPLPIASVALTGGYASQFLLDAGSCEEILAPGTGCDLEVRFYPDWLGPMRATLRVVAGGDVAVRTVALTGTSVKASMTVSPTWLAFGRVPVGQRSAGKAVTVTNTGESVLPIDSIRLEGEDPASFVNSSACATAYGAPSCTITVYFRPRSTGLAQAWLVVKPGGRAPARWIPLRGTGT